MIDDYPREYPNLGLPPLPPAEPGLPSVLLIGDSISIGYTLPVAERLRGVCDVRRVPNNANATRFGLREIDRWLGEVRWGLIHFNWGLHDLCYRHPDSTEMGNRDKVNGSVSVPLDEYRANLQRLVERLRRQADRLVWASTTFVPEGEPGRHQGDEVTYNRAAAEIMARYDIPTNDLHALSATFAPAMFVGPGDVHFTDAGSHRLAAQVADCIRRELGRGSAMRAGLGEPGPPESRNPEPGVADAGPR